MFWKDIEIFEEIAIPERTLKRNNEWDSWSSAPEFLYQRTVWLLESQMPDVVKDSDRGQKKSLNQMDPISPLIVYLHTDHLCVQELIWNNTTELNHSVLTVTIQMKHEEEECKDFFIMSRTELWLFILLFILSIVAIIQYVSYLYYTYII